MEDLSLNQKWVVVGGNGQLGKSLRDALSFFQKSYTILSHNEVDITSQQEVQNLFERFRPDVVVNAAAWTNVDSAQFHSAKVFEVNSFGPKNLALEATRHGTTLVQISTDYVFSGNRQRPWGLSDPPSPVSVYGKSKYLGEKNVLEFCNSRHYVVRTAWLYSEYGSNFVKSILRRYRQDLGQFPVVIDQIGQPTSALDLANQLILLVDSALPSGIFHGTNSGATSRYEFAIKILDMLDLDQTRVYPVYNSESDIPNLRPNYSVLSHDMWGDSGLSPMRHWVGALESSLPSINSAIRNE